SNTPVGAAASGGPDPTRETLPLARRLYGGFFYLAHDIWRMPVLAQTVHLTHPAAAQHHVTRPIIFAGLSSTVLARSMMLAIVEAYRAGLLARRHWMSNIVAGLIVGVVALPLAMAFAIASGVKPEQGIYTAIIAGIIVSLFGGSRIQIAGPTGAFIVILAGIVAEHGVLGLQIATIMAGVILLLFGLARMGAVIKFIPAPVIVGFTAGIGVVIWVGQWKDFFGLPAVEGHHF